MISQKTSKQNQNIRLFTLLLFTLSCQTLLNLNIQNFKKQIQTHQNNLKSEIKAKLNPTLVKALSFGHLPLVIDWIWIQSLLDTGDGLRNETLKKSDSSEHSPLFYKIDLLTDLDPLFFEAYVSGASLLSVLGNDPSGAKELLIKANQFRKTQLSTFPDEVHNKFWNQDWEILVLLGYVNLFELNDLKSAGQAFQEASQIRGAPRYITQLAGRFSKPNGEFEVGIRLLNFLSQSSKDESLRHEYLKKKNSLEISQFMAQLNQSFQEFLKIQPISEPKSLQSSEKMKSAWNLFLKKSNLGTQDPWGGTLSLGPHGTIITSTPHQKVFGLHF